MRSIPVHVEPSRVHNNAVKCLICGKFTSLKFKRGLCRDCGRAINKLVITQLKQKRGYYYQKWLRNIRRSVRIPEDEAVDNRLINHIKGNPDRSLKALE